MRAADPKTDAQPADLKTIAMTERAQEYREFLRFIAQSSGVATYEQMAVIYPAICQAAMEWLLTKNKSVDFGFVILHPRPHRANWKQMMVAMFPTLGTSLLGKSKLVKDALLTSSGFATKLLSGELLAIACGRYVVWGLEAEIKRSWWKAMFRQEGAKLSALGSVDYASHTARQIVSLKPRLLNAYFSFLRQTAYPCAKVQQSRPHRRGFIVPFIPKGRVRAISVADIPVSAVVPRDPQELATPKIRDVVTPNAGLPPVPDLQQEPNDLRLPGRTDVS